LKDEYFRRQLDFLTPKGATIRHAGERFLECHIPALRSREDWAYSVFESLVSLTGVYCTRRDRLVCTTRSRLHVYQA
jgi:hypothetical protein